ncbi:hypothetical protein [Shouchella patagoniensis]|uniref:hypothetical protein n=1 Tax=Shouchella patagoniensis TaxID=228576 RepID=UPI000995450B|nr:hypothetical protein [Shouchella patagoniensis]
MANNKKSQKKAETEEEKRQEELIEFSEDLIFYGTILSTISSAMGLVGVCIAREVGRQKDASESTQEEAEEVATFFAGGALRGANEQQLPNYLYEHVNNMRRELDHVNWQLKQMQIQLDQWKRPPNK